MTSIVSLRYPPQAWLHSAGFDLLWIIGPAFWVTILILLAPKSLIISNPLPSWAWVVLILLVDVGHVYSTLYRTYFSKTLFKKYATACTVAPIACWVIGILLYSIDGMFFWRCLSYVAVFHFVRQQYGFVTLYGRQETQLPMWVRWIDVASVYLVTVYPLVYWHTHLPREFIWFISGDFITSLPSWLNSVAEYIYGIVLLIYLTSVLWQAYAFKYINIPKNLLIIGTALSWYVGIVFLNSDFAFTAINVISHGIPYLALVFMMNRRELRPVVWYDFLPLFLIVLWGLAFLEEGLWDALVWRDHPQLFTWFSGLPQLTTKDTLTWLIPLLALPQATHYVLDGFIWRKADFARP